MRPLPLLLVCILSLFPCAALAQQELAGKYAVTGWESEKAASAAPTAPEYVGEIEITSLGDSFAFSGVVDGAGYRGTGLYDPSTRTLAFVFTDAAGKETGLTVLTPAPKGLKARWIRLDAPSGKPGAEFWRPLE